MESHQPESLQLLLDIPEAEAIFGFDEYASTLTSAIAGTDPHFTIGIFGKWGSGKTTLLKKIESQLKAVYENKVLTVFFDAWRYQREEHMLLPLLDTISSNLRREETHWQTLHNKFARLTKSVATAMTIKLPGIQLETGQVLQRWQQAEEAKSDYYGWLSELQAALDEARQDDSQRRIVILVDDLDRCLPHKVIEVLESIKVMLDVCGLIFVLALDEQVVEKAVENYYGENYRIHGKEYIKKLVQVEFRLPPLRPRDVIDYTNILQQKLGTMESEASATLSEVIPSLVGDNPREVKRFINRVLLATAIARNAGVTVPAKHQVAFMAMDFGWPAITRLLAFNEDIWKYIKDYLEVKTGGVETTLSQEDSESVKQILENNPGLDSFLENMPGKELFNLNIEELGQLLFYSSIAKEEKKKETLEDSIDIILSTLTPREGRILGLRFGLEDGQPRTLAAVGKEFGVTSERIRQIEAKALRKLRHPVRSRRLKDFLESTHELDLPYQKILKAIFGEYQ